MPAPGPFGCPAASPHFVVASFISLARRTRQVSLIPLLLLSPRNPLRWAFAGTLLSQGHICFGDGYSVVGWLSPPCLVRESDAPEKPLHLLSHLRELFSGCLENFFVIGRFRYIPSLRDDWGWPILWVPQRKISPSSGRSRERQKIKSCRSFFRVLSLT